MKMSNEYAQKLSARYANTPKAVFAAVAVSLLMKETGSEEVLDSFVKEWATLWANGIVPQKPVTTNIHQEPDGDL